MECVFIYIMNIKKMKNKKRNIRRLKIKKEKDEINKLYKIYLKNYYEIKNICPYCFIDKNGNNIF